MTSFADVLAEQLVLHYNLPASNARTMGILVAEAVAAAGLAVVQLPEPDREQPRVWRGSHGAFYPTKFGTVGTPDGAITVDEARADAAALLAAANAAEQVTA